MAEYDALPVAACVQSVNCRVMPLGSKLSFNTSTMNSLWTNSSQVIFGMSAIGLNKIGFAKARQVKSRDTSHPMKVTATEDVELNKLIARLYGLPQKTTKQRDYLKELPSTVCVFRSLPWYTAIATPAGARPFADTWPDIFKHVLQFELQGYVNKYVLNYSYSPKKGILKPYEFASVYDNKYNTRVYPGDVPLVVKSAKITSVSSADKHLSVTLQNADATGHHYLKANYNQLIEKYGSTNPGGSHSYLVQPSTHIGINAIQANAPDNGLDTAAEFVNACAYWLVKYDCTVSFDAERMYNYMSYARNMQLDFRADSISDPVGFYANYHVLRYFNEVHKIG